MIVFYDFETTGFVNKRAPLSSDHQPHIVQVAAIVTGDGGRVVASFSLIAKPDGWDIPGAASAVHGITVDIANQFGVAEASVYRLLARFMRQSTLRVAHNEAFDCDILKIAAIRSGDEGMVKLLDDIPSFCTMERTRDICRLSATRRMMDAGIDGFKSPRLEEAYKHFFNEELAGAHDAMADITACKRIYDHLLTQRAAA